MTYPFPSNYEVKCTGYSLVLSQGLLLAAFALYTIDFDVYAVESGAQIVELHNVVSSAKHRAQMELLCGLLWVSFPFFVISLHGTKKLTMSMFGGTKAENLIYLAEKAYTMWILVVCIIVPALILASISFEWSKIDEYSADDDSVPTGYYIQFYSILLIQELMDSAALTEGTFAMALSLLVRWASYFASHGHPVFEGWCGRYRAAGCGKRSRCCWEVTTITLMLICAVVFAIALFEFAESGFFSLNGKGSWLMVVAFALKFLYGLRLIYHGHTGRYERDIVRPFSEYRAKQAQASQRMISIAGQAQAQSQQQQWQMDTVGNTKTPESPELPVYERYESNPATPEHGTSAKPNPSIAQPIG